MEWLNNPRDAQNMEVDIGYIPHMELRSSRPSLNAFHAGRDHRETRLEEEENGDDYEAAIRDITWSNEIPVEEARRLLEVEMYPFKKVSKLQSKGKECDLNIFINSSTRRSYLKRF
jgi:hypothetical protein